MNNSINTSNIIKIKLESMTIAKGQTNIKICSINPSPVKNKTLSMCDYIISDDFDLVALVETWLWKSADGGGVGIINKSSIDLHIILSSWDTDFATFEHVRCNATPCAQQLYIA